MTCDLGASWRFVAGHRPERLDKAVPPSLRGVAVPKAASGTVGATELAHAPRAANGRPTTDPFDRDSRMVDKALARQRVYARAGRTGHGEVS